MAGTMVITLFPTGGALNAAVINGPSVSHLTETNKHVGGSAYRHLISEIDTATLDETVTPSSPNTGAATADVVAIRHQTAIAKLQGGSGNYATRHGALVAGMDVTSLFGWAGPYNASTNTQGRTATSVALTTMMRGTNAETALGSLDVGGATTVTNGVAQIHATAVNVGQTLPMIASRTYTGRFGIQSKVDSSVEVSNATDHAGLLVNGPVTSTGTGAGFLGNATTATLAATASAVAFGNITGGVSGDANKLLAINGSGAVILKAFDSSLIGNRTIKLSTISDLAPSGDGTTRVVTVAAGTYVALNAVPALVQRTYNGGTVTVPSPSGGSQYSCIYLDNTATLQQSPGTVGGAQDTAVLPTGGFAVAWAFMPNGGTAIYSTQADWVAAGSPSLKGYLIPQNVNGGSAGSGGGGSSGAAITSPFAIWGSNAGLGLSANAQGVDAVLSGATALGGSLTVNGVRVDRVRTSESIIADSYLSATLDDANAVSVTGNVDGAITVSGGTVTMKVPASAPPITVKLRGYPRMRLDNTITAGITSNTVTGPGWYTLVADLNGAGPIFTIQLVLAPVAGQVALRKFWIEGSVIYTSAPHGPLDLTKPFINGANFSPMKQAVFFSQLSLAVSTPGITAFAGSALTFELPDANMTAWITASGIAQSTASAADFRIYGMASTGTGVALSVRTDELAWFNPFPASTVLPWSILGKLTGLGPGPVNFGLGYLAAVINYNLTQAWYQVEITSAR